MQKELTLEEKWEKAGLENNFLFYMIMRHNPDVCKELLEILLEIEIDSIEFIQENTIIPDPYSKGIRLDVYAKNSTCSFDLELQAVDTKELQKRARYYQGVMDIDSLRKGEVYSNLKDSYIIFICLDDIFGQGLPVYAFENICAQDNSIKLNDRAYKYFFAASNCDKLLNERQRKFFNLLVNRECNDDFTRHLRKLIEEAKLNFQWRFEYMEFERAQTYARLAGEEKGRKEKAIENALVLIKDFNISPEIAAEKMGADYNEVLIALQN